MVNRGWIENREGTLCCSYPVRGLPLAGWHVAREDECWNRIMPGYWRPPTLVVLSLVARAASRPARVADTAASERTGAVAASDAAAPRASRRSAEPKTRPHGNFEEVPELEAIAQDVRPLRRAEYDKLVELGAFQDERIELLRGVLVRMSPIGARHSSSLTRLNVILVQALSDRATIRVQLPFAALDDSEPEPDFAIVPRGEYDREHPSAAYFIVEISDASLATDRGAKLRLYAECGVPEYWIVNLVDQVIEVYSEPKDGAYATAKLCRKGEVLQSRRFSDLVIRVEDVMR
jgi:Uma2 family endonuclease